MTIKTATTIPTKIVPKFGKWVEKPLRSQILTCSCGHKYIKTRPNQENCIKCMLKK